MVGCCLGKFWEHRCPELLLNRLKCLFFYIVVAVKCLDVYVKPWMCSKNIKGRQNVYRVRRSNGGDGLCFCSLFKESVLDL